MTFFASLGGFALGVFVKRSLLHKYPVLTESSYPYRAIGWKMSYHTLGDFYKLV